MTTDQAGSYICSGLCVMSAGLTESMQSEICTPLGHNQCLCLSLLTSCLFVSGEEEQKGVKRHPELPVVKDRMKSLSKLAFRLGSSCQKEKMNKNSLLLSLLSLYERPHHFLTHIPSPYCPHHTMCICSDGKCAGNTLL